MSNTQHSSLQNDQLNSLNSHLVMIKSLKDTQAENQFFNLLEKAKNILGQVSPHMAKFYFQYGSFLLNKVQNSMDLFNPDAVPQAAAEDNQDYDSAYQDEDNQQQSGANQEKVQFSPNHQEKNQQKNCQEKTEQKHQNTGAVLYQDDNVQITENSNEKTNQKMTQKIPDLQGNNEQVEQDMTDLECAYENLQAALKIYQREHQKIQSGNQSPISQEDCFNHILHIHIRLGELYMLDERFQDAIDEYNTIIKLTRGHQKPQMRRKTSEAHYNIGNCLLHLNKPNCENQAIKQYISSHYELLKFIEEKQNYNITQMQLPTSEKYIVDRFGYLYLPFDSDLVKDMKDVMGLLLDKIEDTALQREQRPNFQREKQKMNQQKQQSGFKQVSKDVKVTNLGTFGNRKKSQPPSVLKQSQNLAKKQTTVNVQQKVQSQQKPEVTKQSLNQEKNKEQVVQI